MNSPNVSAQMVDSSHTAISAERVCSLLVSRRLLSQAKAKEILKRRTVLKQKLEELHQRKGHTGVNGSAHGITIIDIIASLKLTLPGDRRQLLDEEGVYKALAEAQLGREVPEKRRTQPCLHPSRLNCLIQQTKRRKYFSPLANPLVTISIGVAGLALLWSKRG